MVEAMTTKLKLLSFFLEKAGALRRDRNMSRGFTLIELLVVMIIGSLIVTSLMTLVIQLVSTEQRESARTETQREMQLALDYISSDLRQAVYVYDNPSYLPFLPADLQVAADYRPVVAFWKPKPIDPSSIAGLPAYSPTLTDTGCSTTYSGANDARRSECNNLWLQRRTYSLVVYFEVPNDNSNPIWEGQSRIERYELEKYSDVASFTRNPGFVDPSELGAGGFENWPQLNGVNCQTSAACGTNIAPPGAPPASPPAGSMATLVDFVDTSELRTGRGATKRASEPEESSTASNACPANYDIQPTRDDTKPHPSFFMCIRDDTPDPNAPTISSDVRDIQLYLRGNVGARLGGAGGDDVPLDALQTQLTMRGVIDKRV